MLADRIDLCMLCAEVQEFSKTASEQPLCRHSGSGCAQQNMACELLPSFV